jgi:hypothetical protein
MAVDSRASVTWAWIPLRRRAAADHRALERLLARCCASEIHKRLSEGLPGTRASPTRLLIVLTYCIREIGDLTLDLQYASWTKVAYACDHGDYE